MDSYNSDPYYNSAQLVDVPTPTHSHNSSFTASAPVQAKQATFSSSGVVEGLDASHWKNKDTATNCSLCEAPFSSLSKRKVSITKMH